MTRNIWLIVALLTVLVLGINNTVYYFYTKHSLEEGLAEEMRRVAKQIEMSVEQSRIGAELFQEQLGEQLRTAAIAAQFALDPDVEKVTNEQLVELSERLGVLHITLLKRTDDNIMLYKSSDPKQIDVPTNTWKPWYQAFNQLFDDRNVSIDWGQSLPNFWTGPYEFATTDTSKIRKWGYYYDGSTNYIIDPYISYDVQLDFEEATGVARLIRKTLEENPDVLEITGVNPVLFDKGPYQTITYAGEVLNHATRQPIIYGSYTYRVDSDAKNIGHAYESGKTITVADKVNGKRILKSYIPVDIEAPVVSILDDQAQPLKRYVLTITSDYNRIQAQLDRQSLDIVLLIAIVTLLSIAVLFVAMRLIRRSRDSVVVEAQQTYVEEINQMFNMLRGQRHDFSNHVQTMHSMAALGKLEDLRNYANELVGEIRMTNDIINVGNPAIAALVRSKLSQAESAKIAFTSRFIGLEKLDLGVKSLDLTRMIGNLVDNAFDEAMQYPEELRCVVLRGAHEPTGLVFTVSNYCEAAQQISGEQQKLFKSGFTTKAESHHQGLGLSIVKSIADKYKGTVKIEAESQHRIAFTVRIPH
jgi:signal transduction histidine kinase